MLKLLTKTSFKPSYNKSLTIDKLKICNTQIRNVSMKDKKNVKILIIDDSGFDTDRLERLGYKDIKRVASFTSMDDMEIYDIILCDINGVAKDMNEIFQGAALAKSIKDTYPTKIVVIYSSKPQKPDFYEYYKEVDDVIKKTINTTDLSDKLNKYILKLNDPIEIWNATKERLNKYNISSKTIALMEHYYVKSILKNKDYTSEILSIDCGLSSDVKSKLLLGACELVKLYIKSKIKLGL